MSWHTDHANTGKPDMEDHGLQASLGYIVRVCLEKKKKKKDGKQKPYDVKLQVMEQHGLNYTLARTLLLPLLIYTISKSNEQ